MVKNIGLTRMDCNDRKLYCVGSNVGYRVDMFVRLILCHDFIQTQSCSYVTMHKTYTFNGIRLL